MNTLEVIVIACALSMDAFAVSIACGINAQRSKIGHALRVALFFGGFQALMPIAGWLCGAGIRNLIAGFDHWVAFALLTAIGGKMIYEAAGLEEREKIDPHNISVLFLLAIATSIDALAVGLSLSFLGVSIILPALIIGIITFFFSLCGVCIGNKTGHFFENKIEILAGVILIGIGIKIVVEHLR